MLCRHLPPKFSLSANTRFFARVFAIISCLFVASAAIQCGYALYFFTRIILLKTNTELQGSPSKPVSLIICAHNEAGSLKNNLPAILSQKYSGRFEVIVVNDASTDDTARVLQELEQQYDNLWDVVIAPDAERTLPGKKFALSKGVAVAANDWLMLTDADCIPSSNQWLQRMVAPLAAGKQIVAGYGRYTNTGTLLNAFVRWETMHTFLQYSTYALAGMPYMAVGRNLACTKEVLLRAQESEIWNKLPSGDDDLLVTLEANNDNTAVVCDKSAFTCTASKPTWREWAQQKRRHLSTGKYYRAERKLLLGVYALSHAIMWIFFFALLSTGYWKMALSGISIRCIIYWLLWGVTVNKLGEKKLAYFFPFFDIGWMIYNFAFLPYITWKNKTTWK